MLPHEEWKKMHKRKPLPLSWKTRLEIFFRVYDKCYIEMPGYKSKTHRTISILKAGQKMPMILGVWTKWDEVKFRIKAIYCKIMGGVRQCARTAKDTTADTATATRNEWP